MRAIRKSIRIFDKTPTTQWQNMQWIATRKFPIPLRLPTQNEIVTSNTSELINSMIDELQCEGWTESLEGTLHHMAQKISDKRREYISEQGDEIVLKVKAVLADLFHKAAAYAVIKLVWGNQYMVTQRKGNTLNITMNAQEQNVESGKIDVNKSEGGHEMQ